jgi:O-antigen ligase
MNYNKATAVLLPLLFLLFPIVLQLSNVVLLVLIIIFLLTLAKVEAWGPLKELRIIWILLMFYGVVLIGVAYTPATNNWVGLHLSKYARVLYAVIIIALLWQNRKTQANTLKAFEIAMLFILASTWLNIWFLLPWSVSQSLGWGQSHHVFGDYITQNIMMSFFCALACLRALQATTKPNRIIWLVIALLSAISVTHLSQGRTGYALLLVSLLTFAVSNFRGRTLLASMGIVVFSGFLALGASDIMLSRFEAAFEETRNYQHDRQTSIGHRLYNYTTTYKMIREKPLIGHGTGAYHTEICQFLDPGDDCKQYQWHPHNQYLFLGADHGVVGMFLYLSIIGSMYLTAYRSPNISGKTLLAVLASMLLVNSLINSPLWSSRESQFFMYMLGLLVAMATCQKSRSEVGEKATPEHRSNNETQTASVSPRS